jgi:hypothetical protein
MRRQIANYWFVALGAAFTVLLGYNLLSHGVKHVFFFRGLFYRGLLVDETRWQAWADRNRDFFGPLATGAKVAVVSDPRDSTGLLFAKSATGIHVSKTHMMFRQRCGVLFAMDAEEAESWLGLSLPQQGNAFWDAIKRSTSQSKSRVYTAGSLEELKQQGFIEFLKSFSARPNVSQLPSAQRARTSSSLN